MESKLLHFKLIFLQSPSVREDLNISVFTRVQSATDYPEILTNESTTDTIVSTEVH